jgi:hypothetical protein
MVAGVACAVHGKLAQKSTVSTQTGCFLFSWGWTCKKLAHATPPQVHSPQFVTEWVMLIAHIPFCVSSYVAMFSNYMSVHASNVFRELLTTEQASV